MKILLVEDEPKLANLIKKGVEQESYEVDIAYDGLIGRSMFQSNHYEMVILDVNLPLINGFELCKIIKHPSPKTLVLMLTALDSIDDKVMGFDVGADDYLAKPFEFRELLARIRALAKRNKETTKFAKVLICADLELNTESKIAKRGNKTIVLTAKEYTLLELDELANSNWNEY